MNEKITFTDDEKRKLFDPLYDYSDDKANKYYKDLDGLKKFFAYMSSTGTRFLPEEKYELFIEGKIGSEAVKSKCHENGGKIIDPDSESALVQKVYAALWYGMNYEPCLKIQGETLNSVNTTFNKYYECIEKPEHKEERGKMKTDKGGTQDISIKYRLSRFYSPREESREDFSNTQLNEFVSLYHTIGNFMPVPWGCNFPRGSAKVHDYWDLTLLHIYQYYTAGNNIEDIKAILSPNKVTNYDELVQRYKAWLDSFGNWENFVNKNYLSAFVYYKSDGTLYPKELWNGHFDKYESCGLAIPQKTVQCEEYFKNAAECIKERTAHMLGALQGVL